MGRKCIYLTYTCHKYCVVWNFVLILFIFIKCLFIGIHRIILQSILNFAFLASIQYFFFSANWKINSAFFTIENVPIHYSKENNIKKESIILFKIKDPGDSSIILKSDQTTYNLSKRVIYTSTLLQI